MNTITKTSKILGLPIAKVIGLINDGILQTVDNGQPMVTNGSIAAYTESELVKIVDGEYNDLSANDMLAQI
jgi:hypothetical protein